MRPTPWLGNMLPVTRWLCAHVEAAAVVSLDGLRFCTRSARASTCKAANDVAKRCSQYLTAKPRRCRVSPLHTFKHLAELQAKLVKCEGLPPAQPPRSAHRDQGGARGGQADEQDHRRGGRHARVRWRCDICGAGCVSVKRRGTLRSDWLQNELVNSLAYWRHS